MEEKEESEAKDEEKEEEDKAEEKEKILAACKSRQHEQTWPVTTVFA